MLEQDALKKYIIYARKYITPKLSELNKNKVWKFYSELGRESQKNEDTNCSTSFRKYITY